MIRDVNENELPTVEGGNAGVSMCFWAVPGGYWSFVADGELCIGLRVPV